MSTGAADPDPHIGAHRASYHYALARSRLLGQQPEKRFHQVDVEAIDKDRTQVRVTAEKYLGKDDATAAKVMQGIVDHLNKLEK